MRIAQIVPHYPIQQQRLAQFVLTVLLTCYLLSFPFTSSRPCAVWANGSCNDKPPLNNAAYIVTLAWDIHCFWFCLFFQSHFFISFFHCRFPATLLPFETFLIIFILLEYSLDFQYISTSSLQKCSKLL